MKITIFDSYKQKTVNIGYVSNNIFYKPVKRNKHYLRKAKGYAIQAEAYNQLKKLNIEKIVLIENSKRKLEISIENFDKFKGEFEYNHGLQYTINEKYLKEL